MSFISNDNSPESYLRVSSVEKKSLSAVFSASLHPSDCITSTSSSGENLKHSKLGLWNPFTNWKSNIPLKSNAAWIKKWKWSKS